MKITKKLLVALYVFILCLTAAGAQTSIKGEITGAVVDNNGQSLPGATITLTGEKLFQKSLATLSNEQGAFRFVNLNPGEYELEMTMSGFSPFKLVNIQVNAGRTTPVRAILNPARVQEEVTVIAKAPLIETKTPQVTTTYTAETVENIPTTRDIKDLINATAGINDNVAYGARGRVNNSFAEGSMSSTYRLNGNDVSGVDYAYTFITPIWETIEEVQISGVGMSSETGNFTGASVNVITKSGTNQLHGGASFFFTNDHFQGNNSGGLIDLRPGRRDADLESTFHLGGPIVKQKLFFYGAAGYVYRKYEESYGSPMLSSWKRPNYYGKLDWLVNNKNTVSAMVMGNPLSWYDLYMIPGSAASIGGDEFLNSVSWFANWQSILGTKSYLATRYAGYWNKWSRYPKTRGVPRYTDGDTGLGYGGLNYDFDQWQARHEIDSTLTHYVDNLFGTSHEVKLGVEYENGHAWKHILRPGSLSSQTVSGQVLWSTSVGGNDFTDRRVVRFGGFFQDNLRIGQKLNVNLGLRLDSPRLTAVGMSGTAHSFVALSPRLGFSYDLTGNAKNVFHFSYSILYDKMMTGTYGLMIPGRTDSFTYRVYEAPAPFDPTNENIITKFNEVSQPANLYAVNSLAAPIPFDPNFKEPRTELISLGFEKQLFQSYAFEVTYLYRAVKNLVMIGTHTEHTYEPFDWTDPWLGKTVTLWQQTDRLPDELYITNSNWEKGRTHFLMFSLKRRLVGNWSFDASFVYENSKSNVQDPGGNYLFGTPPFNVDNDPQYSQNPLMWGEPWMTHKYSFKLLGTYLAPWGITISGNFRALSGIAWQTEAAGVYANLYRSYSSITILLDPRGANHVRASYLLDLRMGKIVGLGKQQIELRMDVLNVFNKGYELVVYNQPYAIYSLSRQSAYGRSVSGQFLGPRQFRFGIRWRF